MASRNLRRRAATRAESAIAKVVEDVSDESNGSEFGSTNEASSDDDSASSGNASEAESSDADFDIDTYNKKPSSKVVHPKGKTNSKGSKPVPQKSATAKQAASTSNSSQSTTKATNGVASASAPATSNSQQASNVVKVVREVSDDNLKSMIRSFRLTDLQALMIYVGMTKKSGRKTELQNKCIELVVSTSGETKKKLSEKIQELSSAMYKSIQTAPSVNPYSSTYRPSANSVAANASASAGTSSSRSTSSSANHVPLHLSGSSNGPVATATSSRYNNAYRSTPNSNTSPSYPYYNSNSSHLVYPTFPDVKLRNLPFYKVEAVLLRPSSLQPRGMARFQEQTFSFHLTPTQASAIAQSSYRDSFGRQDFKKQLQLRFSLLETSCEQDDNFPASVCVKVNGRLQPLPNPIPTNKPGVEPRRPPKPINITGLCKLSSTVPNYLNVSWAVEVGSGYTVSVYYVDKLSSTDLLNNLKQKGKRHSDYTRALIKDKLCDKDSEIATTSCKVTLACPLGKMRMSMPCRSSTCDHLQCFDANLYLMMNEKKPKWMCPVCNKPALYENLLIDGYFSDILTSKRLPYDEHEIVLHNDASWDPLVPAKVKEERQPKMEPPSPPETRSSSHKTKTTEMPPLDNVKKVETFSVEDDEEDDDEEAALAARAAAAAFARKSTPGAAAASMPTTVDLVTLDSDSEDEVRPPVNKRLRVLDDDDDNNSDSISAFIPGPAPASATSSTSSAPSPSIPPPSYTHGGMRPPNPSDSPELICLDDD